MGLSAVIVGHAHLVLAWLSWRFAKRLVAGDARPAHREAFGALGWTVLAAAVPGAIMLLLPPLLTAVTGAFVIIPAFSWAHRTASREHASLHAAA
jgi:UPF0716 family protein affecting phage T7 exclusion